MHELLSAVALIPARSGSKRLAGKNVQLLGGHPMMAYTIDSARRSGVFKTVVVSTDSPAYAEIARHYGAEAMMRPAAMASDHSPDIDWIEYTLAELAARNRHFDCFSILRPTSPFRTAETIARAWAEFLAHERVDSLRAVEKCGQHPGKMWIVRNNQLLPLLPFETGGRPWHSTPYQALPEVYVQNASLEIAWTRVVSETHSIAGSIIAPFFTVGFEGFDINEPIDFAMAELLIQRGEASLPTIALAPLNLTSLTH